MYGHVAEADGSELMGGSVADPSRVSQALGRWSLVVVGGAPQARVLGIEFSSSSLFLQRRIECGRWWHPRSRPSGSVSVLPPRVSAGLLPGRASEPRVSFFKEVFNFGTIINAQEVAKKSPLAQRPRGAVSYKTQHPVQETARGAGPATDSASRVLRPPLFWCACAGRVYAVA